MSVTLRCGSLSATFAPQLAMLGTSLRHRGDELLVSPRTLAEYRDGGATRLPLLHPWANRLSARRYRVGRVTVDLRGCDLPVDGNGLPIHGALFARPFVVERRDETSLVAALDSREHPDLERVFPFPHRLRVTTALDAAGLTVTTELRATGRRAVPASFGWHPYLRLPGVRRSDWIVRMPASRHAVLDARLIPTGAWVHERSSDAPLGTRTFDDHYALERDRRYELRGGGRAITVTFGGAYAYAQVYAPARRSLVCFEPMVAPVDALVSGRARLVAPGHALRARLRIAVTDLGRGRTARVTAPAGARSA